ncbi:LysE/ArgO family amino acid transporter [Shewanella surugensis]|uniref:LysE family transporter n=1 Tax=Shewanella surugensis TaxID=212020 RepID=A0ABT0LGX3_9GAMM|nr:LysE family transporter [Shewanella surugensis]MCL1126958.1 LysE family transporter [Shewanella surugensis]
MEMAFLQGFGLGGSLVVAVGAQNAFILKQGLKQSHPLLIAALCSCIDALMITFGVLGFGRVVVAFPVIINVARIGGALFLFTYGAHALYMSFQHSRKLSTDMKQVESIPRVLLLTLGLSLLNPSLYLDTVLLLGSISVQFQGVERVLFAVGAIMASLGWFFSLSFGTKYLSPAFNQPQAWVYLDRAICLIMWSIALILMAPYILAS